MLGDGLGKFLACTAACAGEGYIYAFEIIIMLEELHLDLLATECISGTRTSRASEKKKLVNREISLVKNAEELLSYRSACTYNCNFHSISSF